MTHRLIVLGTLLAFGTASAQETTGSVLGRVTGPGGAAVAGARVNASSTTLLGTRSAVTSSDGVCMLTALPPGVYAVRVVAIGYRAITVDSVLVQLGRTVGLDAIPLEAAGAVTLSETRIVASRRSIEQLVDRPLSIAEYADLVYLRPMFFRSRFKIVSHSHSRIAADDHVTVTLGVTRLVEMSALLVDAGSDRPVGGEFAFAQVDDTHAEISAAFPRAGVYTVRVERRAAVRYARRQPARRA